MKWRRKKGFFSILFFLSFVPLLILDGIDFSEPALFFYLFLFVFFIYFYFFLFFISLFSISLFRLVSILLLYSSFAPLYFSCIFTLSFFRSFQSVFFLFLFRYSLRSVQRVISPSMESHCQESESFSAATATRGDTLHQNRVLTYCGPFFSSFMASEWLHSVRRSFCLSAPRLHGLGPFCAHFSKHCMRY